MTRKLTSLVLATQFATLLGMPVHAQQVGDTMVVVTAAGAKVRIGEREVGSASRGAHLIVREVRGGLLRVFCDGEYGWVKRNEVIPLDEGIDFFSAALLAKPSADDHVSRGRLWRLKSNVDKAIADYNEAIRLDPKNQLAYNVRGNAWRDKGDFEKALKDFDEAIRLEPNDPAPYSNRGNLRYDRGEYDKAIADFTEAIRLNLKNALAYNNRGNAWSDKRDYDKAIADYDQSLKIDPEYAPAYNNRGIAWSDKGEYDKAIEDYNAAIRLDAKFAVAYSNRGNAWWHKKDYDKAIADHSEAIRIDSKDAVSYKNRGSAWSDKKEYGRAIADYKEALRLRPKYINGHGALAWLRATCPEGRFRDGREAVEHARLACELDGYKSPPHLETLAAAFAEHGEFAEAAKWQQKAVDAAPEDEKTIPQTAGTLPSE